MKSFFKDLIRAFFIGVIIFIVLGFITSEGSFFLNDPKKLGYAFLYSQLFTVSLFFVNAYYFRFLLKYFGDKTFKAKNLIVGGIGGVLLTIITAFLVRLFIGTGIEGQTFSEFLKGEKNASYAALVVISANVTIIFYIIYYYKNVYDRKITEQKIVAGAASAKFDALKNQLDPHFLFNSLNVLTSLIEENPDAATDFTTALSKVYRYVLEQKNKTLVTVEEEFDFAKLYMSLLTTRFEDSLEFTYPENLRNPEGKVVPLALQLLLENAVKHNQLTPKNKLKISIFEQDDLLWVSNNLQPKKVIHSSTGIGLNNIRERYEMVSPREILIRKNADTYEVGIPIIAESGEGSFVQQKFIDERRYLDARKKVKDLKGFYIHLGVYLLAVPFFIYLNIISTPHFPWALFPIFGWGIGIASHGMEVFNYHPFLGRDWEEKKLKEMLSARSGSAEEKISYRNAKKHVKKLKDFYRTCFMAAIILPLLGALNYYIDQWKNPWFLYAVVGWGFAIVTQAFSLFPFFTSFTKKWEERQLKKYLEQEDKNEI